MYVSMSKHESMCVSKYLSEYVSKLGGACWGGGTWWDWHDDEEVSK